MVIVSHLLLTFASDLSRELVHLTAKDSRDHHHHHHYLAEHPEAGTLATLPTDWPPQPHLDV